MNIDKYLRHQNDGPHHGLEIYDMEGEISSLPEDFFDAHTKINWLNIYGTELTSLPASFGSLEQLRALKLYKTKIKTLPNSISGLKELASISVYTNSLDLNKEVAKLTLLSNLQVLDLHGYRGNEFPPEIARLKQLTKIRIGSELKKKLQMKPFIEIVAELPRLVDLEMNLLLEASTLGEELLLLDKPLKFHGWYSSSMQKQENWPLFLGRARHLSFDEHRTETLNAFRSKFPHDDLSNSQRELLFGIYVKNYTALNTYLPNQLQRHLELRQPGDLILLDKPKGESAKSIREQLASHLISVQAQADKNSLIVIGPKTTVEEAEPFVRNNHTFITIDHLRDVLRAIGDHWLMQETNESSNDQLLQLLASNQSENLHIAFQIIEGGGANKTIQSLLAAIMLAHPDAGVYKEAEKLFGKFGSASFKQHAKATGASLRTSGSTDRKVNAIVNHPDVDEFAFRLMHHCIAGSNKNIADVQLSEFRVRDAKDLEISPIVPFFTHISSMLFEQCEGLQLEKGMPFLHQSIHCKTLSFNSCKVTIPASVSELTHLDHLDLGFNFIQSPEVLLSLTNLKSINLEGTKISEWRWLGQHHNLKSLNINSCALAEMPEEVYGLKNLTVLQSKQNKIAMIDESIGELSLLTEIDLSNNQISAFPYFLGKHNDLKIISLRSNKIESFDSEMLAVAHNNGVKLPWVELNLSRNTLKQFSLKKVELPALRILDISHNQIGALDDTIFRSNTLRELYAGKNDISAIPPAIAQVRYFAKLWLQGNKIERLEDFMARVRVENCDLSDNQINFIHADFDIIGKENHQRLYWKLKNNPISAGLNNFGGLYGR